MIEFSPSSVLGLYRPGERRKRKEFVQLREDTLKRMKREIEERKSNNPVPTQAELRLGCFVEELEPQVRDAVLTLNQKGFTTNNSGFWGEQSDCQIVDGVFCLDLKTKKALEATGMTVNDAVFWGEPGTVLTFRPNRPDLRLIEQEWINIASMLPNRGKPALPTKTAGSDIFRETYTDKVKD